MDCSAGSEGSDGPRVKGYGVMWSARLGARGATAQAKRASARGYMACGATTKKSLGGAGSWMSHGILVWGGGTGSATTSTVGKCRQESRPDGRPASSNFSICILL